MATTHIEPIKQSMIKSIRYILNPAKTENGRLTASFNCSNEAFACYRTMMNTKEQYRKKDDVQGHMIYFNFKPGEVTPDKAFEIVKEFARRYLGDRYETVLGIHTDKEHIHGHIAFNSVSFADSKKYHSSVGSYYNDIRALADELCRENGLSVIQNPAYKQSKHYIEWKLNQQGFKTWKELMQHDIDLAIKYSISFPKFLIQLENMGYTVNNDPSRKHITIQAYGMNKPMRLNRLGENYSENAITNRIHDRLNNYSPVQNRRPKQHKKHHAFSYKKSFLKMTRFQALYLRYKYMLKSASKNYPIQRKHYPLRQDLKNQKQHLQAYHFIREHKLTSVLDILALQESNYQKLNEVKLNIENIRQSEAPYLYDFRLLAEYERYKTAFLLSEETTAFPFEKAEYFKAVKKLEQRGYTTDEQIQALSEKKAEIYEAKIQIKEDKRQIRQILTGCKNALLSYEKIQSVKQEMQNLKNKAKQKNQQQAKEH